jgi:hypothetical protein
LQFKKSTLRVRVALIVLLNSVENKLCLFVIVSCCIQKSFQNKTSNLSSSFCRHVCTPFCVKMQRAVADVRQMCATMVTFINCKETKQNLSFFLKFSYRLFNYTAKRMWQNIPSERKNYILEDIQHNRTNNVYNTTMHAMRTTCIATRNIQLAIVNLSISEVGL